MKKKILSLLLTAICTGMIMTGCGGGNKTSDMDYAEKNYASGSTTTADEWYQEESIDYDYSYGDGSDYETAEEAYEPENPGSLSDSSNALSQRKLITTVSMDVETEEFTDLTITVENKVKALGGYMESYNKGSESRWGSDVRLQYANMTIRVPADKLEDLLSTVKGTANVVDMTSNTEDVTLTYVDIQSRKESLQVEYNCLLELLAEAESVDQIIMLQNRLTEVRYQIESMESRLRTYDNQVDYSTVYLYVKEVERVTPVITKEETTGDKIKSGLSENMYAIGAWFKNFFIGFVIFLPYLALIAVIVIITLLAVFIPLRISKKKREKKVQEWQRQQEMLQIQREAAAENTNQDS